MKKVLPILMFLAFALPAAAQLTGTSLTAALSSTDATSYNTASVTPSANKLVILTVWNAVSSGTPNTPTATGNGLTYVELASLRILVAGLKRLTVFRALGASPSAGAITIDFAGQTQLSCAWSVVEFGGVDTSGTNGSGAVLQPTTGRTAGNGTFSGITLAAFSSASNGTFLGAGLEVNNSITMEAGWTLQFINGSTGDGVGRLATQWVNANDTSPTATTTGTPDWGGIAFEIVIASSAAGPRHRVIRQ